MVVGAIAHLLPGHHPSRPRRGPRSTPRKRCATNDATPLIVAPGRRQGLPHGRGVRARAATGSTSRSRAGEMLAIVGASGVGKSTLLHVLGTLDRPEAGTVTVGGRGRASRCPRTGCARSATGPSGFVFQFHHLLPEFTALENVMMPLLIARRPDGEARRRADALLDELGLGRARATTGRAPSPGASSSGWRWPAPWSSRPRALLADEPSGNLDQETGDRLHDLLRRLNQEKGITVVVVTHNERLAAACDRVLRLEGGRLHNV